MPISCMEKRNTNFDHNGGEIIEIGIYMYIYSRSGGKNKKCPSEVKAEWNFEQSFIKSNKIGKRYS